MKITWYAKETSEVILEKVKTLKIEKLFTFDQQGVSGHPNHISCYEGA